MSTTKTRRVRACAALSAILIAAGCGGGGGGGGSGGPVDNSWLTFNPATSDVTGYAGESTAFRITATSTRTISGVINVGIIDTRGVIDPSVQITPSGLTYAVDLRVASTLAVGDHSGNLEVRLCRDNPTVCAQPIDGSPWLVPYRIRVRSATNLTPLAALPGAADWSSYQGNAAHTGFVGASVQAANFNRRWVVNAEAGSLATVDGRVVISPPSNRAGAVIALAEHDGAERWRYGSLEFYSGVATGEGRVWFVEQGITGTPPKALRGLSATDGSAQAVAVLSQSNPTRRLAPVVADGSVFVDSGGYATIGRYRASDGAEQWNRFLAEPFGQPAWGWSPSVAGGRAVMFDYHRLWSADAATGTNQGSIEGPNAQPGTSGVWEVSGAAVLGSGPLAFVSAYYSGGGTAYGDGRLVAFNLDTRTVAWNVNTTVRSNPVLAGHTVYTSMTGGALQAHSAASGGVLWRWDAPAGQAPANASPDQPLIVVGNYAFVGLNDITHAIDLSTRQSVWTYPAAGPMAVSANGTLFIAGGTRLHAINLR